MRNYDYDLFVIGAGSGGVRAARVAAGFGARVGIAEERYLGGTCVNVGCVPKKLFVYGAHFAEDFDDARAYGWDVGGPDFHWPTLRDNKTREIERLNGIYHGLLDGAGVEILAERAVLTGPHRVRVGDRTLTAENILVATGSWPVVPPFPGNEHVITSNEAFYLDEFPERVLIIGGGYIAVEFAGIYAGLGAQVSLAYRGELFLRGFDGGIRRFVADEIRSKGVELRFDARIHAVERRGRELRCRFEDGRHLDVDLVMVATGRSPVSGGLGLEAAGVNLGDAGSIPVDRYYRTNVPHIYAIGDVIDRLQLTPVAIAEGMCVAHNLFNGESRSVDYGKVPTAVFCQPNIGTVGPTEEEARRKHPHLVVYESSFKPMKHTLTGRGERTMMKLLVDGEDDRVLAAHMCGPEAGEIIQGLSVAITAGATKGDFDATIGIHPTAAEEFVTMRDPIRRLEGHQEY
ncbi:MAG: glutathione-disulfide reductase [Gammaproteobacteria bacterium]|nr:glutathione-disulfide reductase [Gammaproteobacteria bacterium]